MNVDDLEQVMDGLAKSALDVMATGDDYQPLAVIIDSEGECSLIAFPDGLDEPAKAGLRERYEESVRQRARAVMLIVEASDNEDGERFIIGGISNPGKSWIKIYEVLGDPETLQILPVARCPSIEFPEFHLLVDDLAW